MVSLLLEFRGTFARKRRIVVAGAICAIAVLAMGCTVIAYVPSLTVIPLPKFPAILYRLVIAVNAYQTQQGVFYVRNAHHFLLDFSACYR